MESLWLETLCPQLLCWWAWDLLTAERSAITLKFSWNSKNLGCSKPALTLGYNQSDVQTAAAEQISTPSEPPCVMQCPAAWLLIKTVWAKTYQATNLDNLTSLDQLDKCDLNVSAESRWALKEKLMQPTCVQTFKCVLTKGLYGVIFLSVYSSDSSLKFGST